MVESSRGGWIDSDNSKLSSCGGDRQLLYWDVSTGRIIRKFQGHDSEVWSFTWHHFFRLSSQECLAVVLNIPLICNRAHDWLVSKIPAQNAVCTTGCFLFEDQH